MDIVTTIRRYKSENGLSMKDAINLLEIEGFADEIKQFEGDIVAVGTVENVSYKPGAQKKITINDTTYEL